jgi:hypothetical protein
LATPLSFAKLWIFSSLATPLWQIGCVCIKYHSWIFNWGDAWKFIHEIRVATRDMV